MCWKRGGGLLVWGHGSGDLCLERMFRGSVWDTPEGKKLEKSSAETKLDVKGVGKAMAWGRKEVSWRRCHCEKKLEVWSLSSREQKHSPSHRPSTTCSVHLAQTLSFVLPLEHLHVAAAALSPAELRLSLARWQVLICNRLHNVPAPSGSQLALTFCAPCRSRTAAQLSAQRPLSVSDRER